MSPSKNCRCAITTHAITPTENTPPANPTTQAKISPTSVLPEQRACLLWVDIHKVVRNLLPLLFAVLSV